MSSRLFNEKPASSNLICRLTTISSKYEAVRGISLNEVIKKLKPSPSMPSRLEASRPRKISTKSTFSKYDSVQGLSLNDVIKQRKQSIPGLPKLDKSNDSPIQSPSWFSPSSALMRLSLDYIIQNSNKSSNCVSRLQVNKPLPDVNKVIPIASKDSVFIPNCQPLSPKLSPMKQNYNMNENIYDEDDPFIPTPLDLIPKLTEKGLMIQSEVGMYVDFEKDRDHKWRAKFTCEDLIIQCVSGKKILARQAAAAEFLNRIDQTSFAFKNPQFKIPEACYYDPVVCNLLPECVRRMGFGTLTVETNLITKNRHNFFITTYFIGEDEFIGSSYHDKEYSKILAAKNAYETLTSRRIKRFSYIIDSNKYKSNDYIAKETEASHVITVLSEKVSSCESSPQKRHMDLEKEKPIVDEDLFVDDSGNYYTRLLDGSNKIRKLRCVTVDNVVNVVEIEAEAPLHQNAAEVVDEEEDIPLEMMIMKEDDFLSDSDEDEKINKVELWLDSEL